ncbi:MAG: macro domain-containing protein [Gammaproteobacteria bacterium]|nr:macro domain-containing protein [Gammaproteobacteria bacterium]
MAINLMRGDLLRQDDVDAIVNTVNCVGIMGKGIALQFKNKWPDNFKAYEVACKKGEVKLGHMWIFDAGGLVTPNYIINFPTKQHWRGKSEILSIRDGLSALVAQIKRLGIRSIAIPPLGCGNGGLQWTDVRPLIEAAFADVTDVEVRLFEPGPNIDVKEMVVKTPRPKMTPGRAAILKVIEIYREMEYGLSKIEVQKLAYFLQLAGTDLRLKFVKQKYGPYSEELKHALDRMEGHFIRGVGDGVMEAEIEPDKQALAEADKFVSAFGNDALNERVQRVARLIDGFQTPYGMELFSHRTWVAANNADVYDAATALSAIQQWNPRKQSIMKPAQVSIAWGRLAQEVG